MNKNKSNLGKKLFSALTQEQIASLLDTVGTKTLLDKVKQGGKNKDHDMAETVEAVLGGGKKSKNVKSGKGGSGHLASDRKIVQEWDDLWQRWYKITAGLGDEDGDYVYQEHHWESPDFDGSALASDLEKVSAEMVKKIDEVFPLVDEPDLFTEALEEIDEGIQSFPEWFGAADGDGCMLEAKTTMCILKWTWLGSKDISAPGTEFLKRVEKIDRDDSLTSLDRDTIVSFVTKLPDPVCLEIFGELRNGRFKEAQDNVYSQWHTIVHEFERRYNKDLYLSRCSRDLEKDWSLGGPLITKAMASKDWPGAEKWLAATFTSYMRQQTGAKWFPESSLLMGGYRYCHDGSENVQISKLLGKWASVSEKLGNEERSRVARFQAVVVSNTERMAPVIEAFKTIGGGKPPATLEALFKQWQGEMALQSIDAYEGEKRFVADTWIHWAIACRADDENGIEGFRKRVRDWLRELKEDGALFRKQWESLACLTADLAGGTDLSKRFPGLFSTALQSYSRKSDIDVSRRSVFHGLYTNDTLDTVMEVWKDRFAGIIPDPATSSNDYLEPVAWVKALRELNPGAYASVVKKWSDVHRLRRNLWKAMAKEQLPVGG